MALVERAALILFLTLVQSAGASVAADLVRSSQAVVVSVRPGLAAGMAGVRPGDRIVGLDEHPNPTLGEMEAERFDVYDARSTRLEVERGGERVAVELAQGGWGCDLRPDLSAEAAARLEAARAAGAASDWATAEERWQALVDEAKAAGLMDTAGWLELELGRALRAGRQREPAIAVLGAPVGGGIWALEATLELADMHAGGGRFEQADAAYGKALELARASGVELRAARVLSAWGRFRSFRGDLPEARRMTEEALAIRERAAPDSVGVARSLTDLGLVLWSSDDRQTALDDYDRALSILETADPDGPQTAETLNDRGLALHELGQLRAARDDLSRSLGIQQRLAPGSYDVARGYSNLGAVVEAQGELGEAEEDYRQAQQILERIAPGSLPAAAVQSGLGNVALKRGDLAGAIADHARALELRRRASPGSLLEAESLTGLGNARRGQGDLVGARELYLQAETIREHLQPDSLAVAESRQDLAEVAAAEGDASAAHQYALEALTLVRQLSPEGADLSRALIRMAAMARSLGDLETARSWQEEGVKLAEQLAAGSLYLATAQNELASLELENGHPEAAKEAAQKSLDIENGLAPDGLQMGVTWSILGRLAREGGDLDTAREDYQKSVAIEERMAPGSLRLAETLAALAEVEIRAGDSDKALALAARAVDAIEAGAIQLGAPARPSRTASREEALYTRLIELELQLGRVEAALGTLERSHARGLLELMSSRWIDLSRELPQELLARRLELAEQRQQLLDRLASADGSTEATQVEEWILTLRELAGKRARLADAVCQASPLLASLEDPRPLDDAGVTAALEPGTLLVAWAVGDGETYLFRLYRGDAAAGDLVWSRLAVTRSELEQEVGRLEELVGPQGGVAAGSPGAWRSAASALFEKVLGPARADIARCRRLLVVPDGPLHRLPFSVLVPSSAGGGLKAEPLAAQRPITIAPSVTVYAGLAAEQRGSVPAAGPRWIGFGDPDVGAVASAAAVGGELARLSKLGFTLGPLPGSRSELETVARLFGTAGRTLLGPAASEGAVRSLPPALPFLHFACRSLLDDRLPMSSAVELSIPAAPQRTPDSADDGLLQAWEVLQGVRIRSDGVVLSACEGHRGGVPGAGATALSQAFLLAGARNVVTSLWSTPAQATTALMEELYRQLRRGVRYDLALQRAQQRLMRSTQWAHPSNWAAFELHGRGDRGMIAARSSKSSGG